MNNTTIFLKNHHLLVAIRIKGYIKNTVMNILPLIEDFFLLRTFSQQSMLSTELSSLTKNINKI